MPLIELDEANAFETANDIGVGDADAGAGGVTVSSLTNENVLDSMGLGERVNGRIVDHSTGAPVGRHFMPGLAGNPQAEHPYWTIGLILAALLGLKFIPKGESEESKPIKISLQNFLRIFLMSALGIIGAKMLFAIWLFPSVSPTIEGML